MNVDRFAASAIANGRLTWPSSPQYSASGRQWFLHPGDRIGSQRLHDTLSFQHGGKDAQRFIHILPRTPLCQCLRHHLFGAWLAAAYNDYGDRYQILKIALCRSRHNGGPAHGQQSRHPSSDKDEQGYRLLVHE